MRGKFKRMSGKKCGREALMCGSLKKKRCLANQKTCELKYNNDERVRTRFVRMATSLRLLAKHLIQILNQYNMSISTTSP
jgi:hypothetical protein